MSVSLIITINFTFLISKAFFEHRKHLPFKESWSNRAEHNRRRFVLQLQPHARWNPYPTRVVSWVGQKTSSLCMSYPQFSLWQYWILQHLAATHWYPCEPTQKYKKNPCYNRKYILLLPGLLLKYSMCNTAYMPCIFHGSHVYGGCAHSNAKACTVQWNSHALTPDTVMPAVFAATVSERCWFNSGKFLSCLQWYCIML